MSALSATSIDEAERVRLAHTRATSRLAASERLAEAVVGGGFALAVIALALASPVGSGVSLLTTLSS